jgi:hypothetical protein
VIVGQGTNPEGQTEGWVVNLAEVPEPGTSAARRRQAHSDGRPRAGPQDARSEAAQNQRSRRGKGGIAGHYAHGDADSQNRHQFRVGGLGQVLVTECGSRQDIFYVLHDQIFSNSQSRTEISSIGREDATCFSHRLMKLNPSSVRSDFIRTNVSSGT